MNTFTIVTAGIKQVKQVHKQLYFTILAAHLRLSFNFILYTTNQKLVSKSSLLLTKPALFDTAKTVIL